MIPSVRQTTLEWPEATLGCPLASIYNGNVSLSANRTGLDPSPPAYLRLRFAERRHYTVGFAWTLDQLKLFETFVETTLNGGMRWFMMKQLGDEWGVPMFCHMVEGYTISKQSDRPGLYRVQFEVDSFWRTG